MALLKTDQYGGQIRVENRLLEAAGVSLRVHLMDKQWVKARSRIWAVPQQMKFIMNIRIQMSNS